MTPRSAFDWFFRDRHTGRITVAQPPNRWAAASTALGVAGVALGGRPGRLVRAARAATVTVWATDELARGVNPWRRCLGATVLGVQLRALARR